MAKAQVQAPVAVAVTTGKLSASSASVESVINAAKELLNQDAPELPEGDFWCLAFEPSVLKASARFGKGYWISHPRQLEISLGRQCLAHCMGRFG